MSASCNGKALSATISSETFSPSPRAWSIYCQGVCVSAATCCTAQALERPRVNSCPPPPPALAVPPPCSSPAVQLAQPQARPAAPLTCCSAA